MSDKVYDIEESTFIVDFGDHGTITKLNVDVSDDGFGISPEVENSVIEGIDGIKGFNSNPSTEGSATISLLETTDSKELSKLNEAWKNDITCRITITPPSASAIDTIELGTAIISNPPEHTVDDNEAGAIEYEFAGYGYDVTYVEGNE